MISGLVTTLASMPVDIAKTRYLVILKDNSYIFDRKNSKIFYVFRLQNMKMIDGKPEYKGAFDVWGRIVRNEGFLALWKGFTPYYARLAPHVNSSFLFLNSQY